MFGQEISVNDAEKIMGLIRLLRESGLPIAPPPSGWCEAYEDFLIFVDDMGLVCRPPLPDWSGATAVKVIVSPGEGAIYLKRMTPKQVRRYQRTLKDGFLTVNGVPRRELAQKWLRFEIADIDTVKAMKNRGKYV